MTTGQGDTAEYRAFRQFFHDLVGILASNVHDITTQLFSERLVSLTVLQEATTIGIPDNQKITHVLQPIQASIIVEPGKFNQFLGVLRKYTELGDVAYKLEACRDQLRSEPEAPRHVGTSIMRSAHVVAPSPPTLQRTLGERNFPSMAGTPMTQSRPSSVVPPSNLPLRDRKKNSTASASPSPSSLTFIRPVPCTDENEKDTPMHAQRVDGPVPIDQAQQIKGCKCEIKRLEQALIEKDLTVKVLSVAMNDLHIERDGLRVFVCTLTQELEEIRQERDLLVEQVTFYEEDRKGAEVVHSLEMEHMQRQLKAERDEKKELMVQLDVAHHKIACQKEVERRAKLKHRKGHHNSL